MITHLYAMRLVFGISLVASMLLLHLEPSVIGVIITCTTNLILGVSVFVMYMITRRDKKEADKNVREFREDARQIRTNTDGILGALRLENKEAINRESDTAKELEHAKGRREGIESTEK
jgi:hypothetical protein